MSLKMSRGEDSGTNGESYHSATPSRDESDFAEPPSSFSNAGETSAFSSAAASASSAIPNVYSAQSLDLVTFSAAVPVSTLPLLAGATGTEAPSVASEHEVAEPLGPGQGLSLSPLQYPESFSTSDIALTKAARYCFKHHSSDSPRKSPVYSLATWPGIAFSLAQYKKTAGASLGRAAALWNATLRQNFPSGDQDGPILFRAEANWDDIIWDSWRPFEEYAQAKGYSLDFTDDDMLYVRSYCEDLLANRQVRGKYLRYPDTIDKDVATIIHLGLLLDERGPPDFDIGTSFASAPGRFPLEWASAIAWPGSQPSHCNPTRRHLVQVQRGLDLHLKCPGGVVGAASLADHAATSLAATGSSDGRKNAKRSKAMAPVIDNTGCGCHFFPGFSSEMIKDIWSQILVYNGLQAEWTAAIANEDCSIPKGSGQSPLSLVPVRIRFSIMALLQKHVNAANDHRCRFIDSDNLVDFKLLLGWKSCKILATTNSNEASRSYAARHAYCREAIEKSIKALYDGEV